MARMSSPWRALRPALLAGAAAVAWLTLSPAAASADTAPDSSSLLGSVTGSISSLTHDLAETVSLSPTGSPAGPAATPGLVQPSLTQVSGLADNLIAAVPVVNQAVPSGTVSVVTAPLVEVADAVTAGVVQVVVVPATDAVPILEPALQPVSDILTGAVPLPASATEPVQTDLPAVLAPAPASSQSADLQAATVALETAPGPDPAAEVSPTKGTADGNASLVTAGAAVLANTSILQPAVSDLAVPASEQPLTADPSPVPAHVPAAPASGTGSSGTSSGPSGAAAWLSPFDFGLERPGDVLAVTSSEHAPAPVSFDPGSSPD